MSLLRNCLLGYLLVACSQPLSAQQTAPTDAREFLIQHALFENSSKTARADEQATLRHARFYLHAGAEVELRHEIDKLTENHPVALRYAMLADCWNPETYSQGLTRSEEWLRLFPDGPQADRESVLAVRDFLTEKEERRDAFLDHRSTMAWMPFLSLASVFALVTGGMRWWL